MFNANEARLMTNTAKANEIAKMNKIANNVANGLGEQIKAAAEKGESNIDIVFTEELKELDVRTRVCEILRNNDYHAKVYNGRIFIAW